MGWRTAFEIRGFMDILLEGEKTRCLLNMDQYMEARETLLEMEKANEAHIHPF